MIRNLKALGLALVAVFALTAMSASAASAAQFHSAAENTTVEGTQTSNHIFTTPAGKVTCKKAVFIGSQSAKTTSEITINPTYSECTTATIFGTISVTVDFVTNSCDYKFTSGGEVHIICGQAEGIIINGPGCKITVPAQTVGRVIYTNSGTAPKHISVSSEVSGIISTATGFFCSSTGESKTGTYTGSATVKGFSGGKQVDIFYE